MSSKDKKDKDLSEDQFRLEFVFDKGINLKDRIIQITGEIEDAASFDWLDAALTEMERDSKRAVTLKINSPGGSVYEALAMVDRIKDSKCQIITKCYGHAMSAASLILAAGDKRYIGSRSWLMVHEMSYDASGAHSNIKDQVQQAEREMQEWSRAMAEFTNQPTDFWLKAAHKQDFYLSAEECIMLGVVDGTF